jgi:hypothetical protein
MGLVSGERKSGIWIGESDSGRQSKAACHCHCHHANSRRARHSAPNERAPAAAGSALVRGVRTHEARCPESDLPTTAQGEKFTSCFVWTIEKTLHFSDLACIS